MMENELSKTYIKYLSEGNLEGVLSLFSADAVVHSPLYGESYAKEFYETLFRDTNDSELEIRGVFEDKTTGDIALHFDYIWTLKAGEKVFFEVVDIIRIDENGKIYELRIIYDTVQSRPAVNRLHI